MKKKSFITFIAVFVSGLMLGSCASSGWTCSKRYCNENGKQPVNFIPKAMPLTEPYNNPAPQDFYMGFPAICLPVFKI